MHYSHHHTVLRNLHPQSKVQMDIAKVRAKAELGGDVLAGAKADLSAADENFVPSGLPPPLRLLEKGANTKFLGLQRPNTKTFC